MANTLTQWNRLEPRARKEDFSRTLRCEIRDPLWMLTRQWQMGELKGEDAGYPIRTRLQFQNTQLDKVQLGQHTPEKIPTDIPLETLVERQNFNILRDQSLSLQLYRKWKRMLSTAFGKTVTNKILKDYSAESSFAMNLPDFKAEKDSFETAGLMVNQELHEVVSIIADKSFHAGKLLIALQEGKKAKSFLSSPGLSTAQNQKLDEIGIQFTAWYQDKFQQVGQDEPKAWHPSHLEYQFSCAAPEPNNKNVQFKAEEYFHGRLDWFSMDVATTNTKKLGQDLNKDVIANGEEEVFPAEIDFSGMPHNRWWEFEDNAVNFASIQPNKTDTGKMLFTEFGLLYGNDWSILPLTLPAGSLIGIDYVETMDNFGQLIISEHYKKYSGNHAWGLFEMAKDTALHKVDNSQLELFIPPVAHNIMESEPIESINFIRDEMANMVWGIENQIPDGLGNGIDGNHFARQVKTYYELLATPDDGTVANKAKIQYKVATEVPENWIPFVAKKISTNPLNRSIQLQRASMPRIVNGLDNMRVLPQSHLLSAIPSPYYLFEEEITKSGIIVKTTWQRTRMPNGKVVIWLGRRKTNGRGEGSSALAYDQIRAKKNR